MLPSKTANFPSLTTALPVFPDITEKLVPLPLNTIDPRDGRLDSILGELTVEVFHQGLFDLMMKSVTQRGN